MEIIQVMPPVDRLALVRGDVQVRSEIAREVAPAPVVPHPLGSRGPIRGSGRLVPSAPGTRRPPIRRRPPVPAYRPFSVEITRVMNEFRSGMIAAVAFDAVGTLIDPEPPVAVAYAETARRQGIILEVVEVRRRFRHAFGTVESDDLRGPLATDEAGEIRRWQRIVAEVLPELPDLGRGFDELWDHFAHPKHWRPFDDASVTLRGLAEAGVPVTIASNFDGRLRPILQGLAELAPWAARLVISSEIGWRKPHPSFYQAVATRLGMEPSRILCVGDDPANDQDGPSAAGFPTLRIDRDGVAGPGTIRSLTEVLGRIIANYLTDPGETLR